MDGPPPPPPPPHGENPQSTAGGNGKRGGLPDGNYDIFIVPPNSAGGGFIYFPSLQPQRNSFIAGSLSTLVLVGIWWAITPVLKEWFSMVIASGGAGVALLMVIVAGGAWGIGRLSFDGGSKPAAGGSAGSGPKPSAQGGQGGSNYNSHGTYSHANGGASGFHGHHGPSPDPPPQPPPRSDHYYQQSRQSSYNFQSNTSSSPPPPQPDDSARNAWERAREETRKREEERKKAEALRKKADELRKRREEAERQKQEEREKEAREREAREKKERLAREREERLRKVKEAKEQEEKDKAIREAREKEAKEKAEREAALAERLAKIKADREARTAERKAKAEQEEQARAASVNGSPPKPPPSNFRNATAKTEADGETLYSYRPYDKPKSPKKAPTAYTSSQSSFAASSYAASESTARSTPPPSHRSGPYSTKDPEKIVIKAVCSFNNALGRTPLATLQSGTPPVSDGLVLRITTEGFFIDDDVRGVPQREWDVKAWTLKQVETGQFRGLHILRASIKDTEGKKYVFVFGNDENWKAEQGISRLRKSPQVRSLAVSGLGLNEAKTLLEITGWV